MGNTMKSVVKNTSYEFTNKVGKVKTPWRVRRNRGNDE